MIGAELHLNNVKCALVEGLRTGQVALRSKHLAEIVELTCQAEIIAHERRFINR